MNTRQRSLLPRTWSLLRWARSRHAKTEETTSIATTAPMTIFFVFRSMAQIYRLGAPINLESRLTHVARSNDRANGAHGAVAAAFAAVAVFVPAN
jgi:hypothetical protein